MGSGEDSQYVEYALVFSGESVFIVLGYSNFFQSGEWHGHNSYRVRVCVCMSTLTAGLERWTSIFMTALLLLCLDCDCDRTLHVYILSNVKQLSGNEQKQSRKKTCFISWIHRFAFLCTVAC